MLTKLSLFRLIVQLARTHCGIDCYFHPLATCGVTRAENDVSDGSRTLGEYNARAFIALHIEF